MLRPHWATQVYGTAFPSASNIVFSPPLVSIILKEGAHHYDLRGAHPDDTDEVKEVRRLEKTHIKKWIQKAKTWRS
ncbi:hypothetical protein OESDEN_24291 [Oesophagostomum dentatum]|uniref:Uncharacterized protein n=1 Tax=Oesophagostomum dentatum TaxID=61180 RepID=A0A0B1RYJ2_OESDE|nr:hypothetical protein OESDEN_24291 [Oesophagostomum dentatum]